MSIATLVTIFAAGFVVMTPVGPVSTICIRRALLYGRRAGIVAGAGDAVAVAAYATIGVTGGTLLPRIFAPFATLWHVSVSAVLVIVAGLIWRARPALPAPGARARGAGVAGGFAATLAIALANPADIVLFAALFTGLGVSVRTPLQQTLFCATIFAGGCAYWVALVLFLDRWRAGLTVARIVWLNRLSSALMIVAAVASVVSLVRSPAENQSSRGSTSDARARIDRSTSAESAVVSGLISTK
jgi:threonine/homoserine/homoserine lactone efflux protein